MAQYLFQDKQGFMQVYGPRQPSTGAYAIVTGVFSQQQIDGEQLTIEGGPCCCFCCMLLLTLPCQPTRGFPENQPPACFVEQLPSLPQAKVNTSFHCDALLHCLSSFKISGMWSCCTSRPHNSTWGRAARPAVAVPARHRYRQGRCHCCHAPAQPPIATTGCVAGNGSHYRDFIHVSDIVDGLIVGMQSKVQGTSINLGTGRTLTVKVS